MAYQSSIYYERCYSADFDPRIRAPEKEACWTAWLEHYTEGQASHRVDYAMSRVEAITRGETLPTLPGMPEASLGPSLSTVTYSASELADPTAGGPVPPSDGTGIAPSDAANGGPPRLTAVPTPGEEPPVAATPPGPAGPTTASVNAPPAPTRAARIPPPPPAPAACSPICTPRWDACLTRCASSGPGCIEACRIDFRTCAAACF